MSRDNWVRSLGLDVDGTLFVDIDNGLRLYDLCLNEPLPYPVRIHPEELMKAENRKLYFRFLSTLKEVESIIFHSIYDGNRQYQKGDIVVDAGARIGTYSAKISDAVGEEGRIIAIEPEPRSFACLRKNIKANQLNNVTAIQKLLWSRTEQRDFYLSENAASHSAYRDAFYNPTGETIRVETDTLDNILEILGVASVDFIKMDIEGSEIEALGGMENTLVSNLQLAIAAYHPIEGTLSHTEIIPQLEQFGFKTVYDDGIVKARRQASGPKPAT